MGRGENKVKIKEKKIERKGSIFLTKFSLGEIRLMTSPSSTVQKILDRVGKAHKLSKYCLTELKCIEISNLFW